MARKPGKTRKPASERREEIMEAARDIIRDNGLSGLTTRAIADRVGVAQPTFFLHFESKAALIMALIGAAEKKLRDGLDELDLENKPPEEALRALIGFHFSYVQSQPCLPRIRFSEEFLTGNPEVKVRMEQFVECYLGIITDLIAAGRESGVFRNGLPPAQQAKLIIAMFQGLAFRWILEGFSNKLPQLAEPVADQLLFGLRASD